MGSVLQGAAELPLLSPLPPRRPEAPLGRGSRGGGSQAEAWRVTSFPRFPQEDYHRLLTKYAEAENTIDQLRLGAKVLGRVGWRAGPGPSR